MNFWIDSPDYFAVAATSDGTSIESLTLYHEEGHWD